VQCSIQIANGHLLVNNEEFMVALRFLHYSIEVLLRKVLMPLKTNILFEALMLIAVVSTDIRRINVASGDE